MKSWLWLRSEDHRIPSTMIKAGGDTAKKEGRKEADHEKITMDDYGAELEKHSNPLIPTY